jgi:hypothetical protein
MLNDTPQFLNPESRLMTPLWGFSDQNFQLATLLVATVDDNTHSVAFSFWGLANCMMFLDAQGTFFRQF